MKLIFVLLDSLNRQVLQRSGGDIEPPNFQRLAERSGTFDRNFIARGPAFRRAAGEVERRRRPCRLHDEAVEARLYAGLREYMQRHDAPAKYYGWLGLEPGRDSRVAP